MWEKRIPKSKDRLRVFVPREVARTSVFASENLEAGGIQFRRGGLNGKEDSKK